MCIPPAFIKDRLIGNGWRWGVAARLLTILVLASVAPARPPIRRAQMLHNAVACHTEGGAADRRAGRRLARPHNRLAGRKAAAVRGYCAPDKNTPAQVPSCSIFWASSVPRHEGMTADLTDGFDMLGRVRPRLGWPGRDDAQPRSWLNCHCLGRVLGPCRAPANWPRRCVPTLQWRHLRRTSFTIIQENKAGEITPSKGRGLEALPPQRHHHGLGRADPPQGDYVNMAAMLCQKVRVWGHDLLNANSGRSRCQPTAAPYSTPPLDQPFGSTSRCASSGRLGVELQRSRGRPSIPHAGAPLHRGRPLRGRLQWRGRG